MADLTIPQHDTWPPIRGRATDADGALALQTASSLKFIANQVGGTALISGAAVAISPPDSDGMNWTYTLTATDTAIVGDYQCELEITWDSTSSPPQVQTVPNVAPRSLTIRADEG